MHSPNHADNSILIAPPPKGKLRFVVLEHLAPRGRHWDLMLEHEGRLRTWALGQPPDTPGDILAEALPDHRLAYLDYEGPISGDRGQVLRWDAGAYLALPAADPNQTEEIYLLQGQRLHGIAHLLPPTAPSAPWLFRFEPA